MILTLLTAAVSVAGAPSSYMNERHHVSAAVDKRWNCEPHVCASAPGADAWIGLLCGSADPSRRNVMDDLPYRLGNCSPRVCAANCGGQDWIARFCDAGSPSRRDVTQREPSSVDYPANYDPFISFKELPDNVPANFWEMNDSPAKNASCSDYLKYEFLYCSAFLEDDETRVHGDCNYMAGAVARGSELHLYMRNTKSLFGTCGLTDNLKGWHPDIAWGNYHQVVRVLKNGLCQYSIEHAIDFLKVIN